MNYPVKSEKYFPFMGSLAYFLTQKHAGTLPPMWVNVRDFSISRLRAQRSENASIPPTLSCFWFGKRTTCFQCNQCHEVSCWHDIGLEYDRRGLRVTMGLTECGCYWQIFDGYVLIGFTQCLPNPQYKQCRHGSTVAQSDCYLDIGGSRPTNRKWRG